jgi:6-pyruvoyltetrahydropterin/6-carboxytetrahydropterin synthase
MLTCTKKWPTIPFAHRQPAHAGHCKKIHGHNWAFELTFACNHTDACNFVVDFGQLKEVKAFLDTLDHATVLQAGDPFIGEVEQAGLSRYFDFVQVPDPSSEGLAQWAYAAADEIVRRMTGGRAWVQRCTVYEDDRNSASYATD